MIAKKMPAIQQIGIELDPTIQYSYSTSNVASPNAIFITGATGLLGANLLGDLLENTTADFYCLVRADSTTLGKSRIRQQLKFYKIWKDTYNKRITPILGNLEQSNLGLTDEDFDCLAKKIDVIYHCGASTNLMLPYEQLYDVNVGSTESLLRLAGLYRTKVFHYVSTISVLSKRGRKNKRAILLEKNAPADSIDDSSGYIATKTVAEHLVRQAIKRGLPCSVYRIGRIMGHSHHGQMNSAMTIPTVIWKASILLGMAPNVDKEWSFVPVDFVSKAIGYLSRQSEQLGKTYHVYSRYSVSWKTIFQIIRQYGYPLKDVSLQEWIESVEGSELAPIWGGKESAVEISLLHTVTKSFFSHGNPEVSTYNLLEGLKGSQVECPPIDDRLLRLYLRWFEKSGFLPPPPSNVVNKWRRRSAAKA